MAFKGRHQLKVDQKGRFRLPSIFLQDGLEESFIVTNSLYKNEKCLDLYTVKDWDLIQDSMKTMPQFDAHVQAFQRFYVSSAQAVTKDGQDRILIPTQLREFAGFDDQVVAIGMGNKIELWNEKSWQKIFTDIATNYDDILKAVSQFQQTRKT